MELNESILLTGIIAAAIWMAVCVFVEGKARKYIIMIGIMIDIILFIICRNSQMLLVGLLGGLACGLIPGLGGSLWKYETAVKELNGIKNWVVVSMIFFVMVFMTLAIAWPNLKIAL
ncbi:MAG: hypothetical protein K2J67_02695 [Lachnospiraceae bacterium]|nr:hypothetical protein [Lachnospiraceae bacterium]